MNRHVYQTYIYQNYITRADLIANRGALYIFGDNEQRSGYGGQAKEMRGEMNSFGFVTKHAPGMDTDDCWSDSHFQSNKRVIDHELESLTIKAPEYRILVWPYAGIGTGYSKLPQKAPMTWDYLLHCLQDVFHVYYHLEYANGTN